jgi:hypothetical protein
MNKKGLRVIVFLWAEPLQENYSFMQMQTAAFRNVVFNYRSSNILFIAKNLEL